MEKRQLIKSKRFYRSKSTLEVAIKPGKPQLDSEGKLIEWDDGIVFLNWFKRNGMDQPLIKESKITVAMSNNEIYGIINHFRRYDIGVQGSFVHNNKTTNEIKTVSFQWYKKDDNATPAYFLNAAVGDNKISVSLTEEDIQVLEQLNSICIAKTTISE